MRIINHTIPIIFGDEDILIEDEKSSTKVAILPEQSERDIFIKVAHADGVTAFFITRKMAEELSDRLREVIND